MNCEVIGPEFYKWISTSSRQMQSYGHAKLGRTVIMERKSLDRVELEETMSERDLGVVVNNKLK